MSTNNNKRPLSNSFTTNPTPKKFRQTTLSFAPTPRSARDESTGTISPYFAQPQPKPGQFNSEDSAASIGSLEAVEDSSQVTDTSRIPDHEDDNSQFTEGPDSQLSELDFDSQASASTSAEKEGQQFLYPVPTWSRPIRKLVMSRQSFKPYGARYKFHESRVAAETLYIYLSTSY